LAPEPPFESFVIKGEQLAAQALCERRRARAEEHSVRVMQLWKDDGGAVHVATRVGQQQQPKQQREQRWMQLAARAVQQAEQHA